MGGYSGGSRGATTWVGIVGGSRGATTYSCSAVGHHKLSLDALKSFHQCSENPCLVASIVLLNTRQLSLHHPTPPSFTRCHLLTPANAPPTFIRCSPPSPDAPHTVTCCHTHLHLMLLPPSPDAIPNPMLLPLPHPPATPPPPSPVYFHQC